MQCLSGLDNKKQTRYDATCGGLGTECPVRSPRPQTASSGKKTSALDHLPESVAGAAVFDPTPRVGSAVASNESELRCHPMVHEGRCKHPALHLRYHLQVLVRDVLNDAKGGASIPHCTSGTISVQLKGTRAAGTIYVAGSRHPSCLYSDARVR